MAQRTAEDVCEKYFIAVINVRQTKNWLNDRDNFCEHYEPVEKAEYSAQGCVYPGYEGTSKNHCVEAWEESDRSMTYYENEMCAACKERMLELSLLTEFKKTLTSAKRAIETVGKRVAACKRERQEAGR